MTELRSCPFCADIHIRITKTMHLDGDISYQAMCLHCGAISGHPRMSKEAAIKAWNTRTNRWSLVSDGLPEMGEWLLVWNGCHMVGEIAENGCFYDNCDGLEIRGVTHWMILPSPPGEENQNDRA